MTKKNMRVVRGTVGGVWLSVAAWWPIALAAAELPRVVSKTVVASSAGSGWTAWAFSFYTSGAGTDKMYLGFDQLTGVGENAQHFKSKTSTDNGSCGPKSVPGLPPNGATVPPHTPCCVAKPGANPWPTHTRPVGGVLREVCR
jgi:hypothetical protein